MRILSLVHGPDVRSEFYGDIVRADGYELVERSVVDDPDALASADGYDAVLVFGGQMNVDQEDEHPWLRDEDELIRTLVEREVPVLGVCLGGQLLAKAAVAHVGPSPESERGFVRVALTDDAQDDPLFGPLPHEFDVFSMHEYAFHVPEGAVELARSSVCSQAFRLGDHAWGLQFHPEIRLEQIEKWVSGGKRPNGDAIVAELRKRIDDGRLRGATVARFCARGQDAVPVMSRRAAPPDATTRHRPGVVRCVVACGCEDLDGERGTRSAVKYAAISDQADELQHLLDRLAMHELRDVEIARARDVALARIARIAARAVVFAPGPHVDDGQRRVVEPPGQLVDVHCAATTSSSSRTGGRSDTSSSHAASRGGNSTPRPSRTRTIQGR